MGIYETYTKGPVTINPITGVQEWTEYQRWPGFTNSRIITATPWVEHERDDCFCCSCPEDSKADPHCRNHGFDGKRPCETHNLPGYPGDEMGEAIPASVQHARERQARRRAAK